MNKEQLNKILENHQHWLNQDCDGWCDMKANLQGADLCHTNLSHTNLSYANLRDVNLFGADLRYANLSGADLSDADLRHTNLRHTNLRHANLFGTNLFGTNLFGVDLSGAGLSGADLSYADLSHTNLSYANLRDVNLRCANLTDANLTDANLTGAKGKLIDYRRGKILTESIIGYKKCCNDVIVTLEIPRGAIVFSINGYKCRTNKAKVIGIDGATRAFSFYKYMSYYVGDEFTIYDFNCEYNKECASGVHFFMTRKEAENYG